MQRIAPIAASVLRRAALAPASSIPSNRIHRRFKSVLTVVNASPSAPRQVPTPIFFIAAPGWTCSPSAAEIFAEWIEHFSSQGYQSLLLDLDLKRPISKVKDSAKLMGFFEMDVKRTLRRQKPPVPPIMISRGPACVIAQNWASTYPLSALQLIDPPVNNEYLRKQHPELLPFDLPEFDFEITFPARVVWSQAELQRLQQNNVPWYDLHRIEYLRQEKAGERLDRKAFVTDKDGAENTQEWLEEETRYITSSGEAVVDGAASNASASIIPRFRGLQGPELRLPAWFMSGIYTFQPNSRKFPLTLDDRHLEEKFIRGSGPGGQAINKLSTKVQLTHIPTGIMVSCQESRSRGRNRALARHRMSHLLEKLARGKLGGSRIDKKIEKERRKKMNKKKKQQRRKKEKEQEQEQET